MKLYTFLFFSLILFQKIDSKENQDLGDTSMILINDIANITDDLASLIITCKYEKNPETIKLLLVNLLKNIAKTSPHIKQLIGNIKEHKKKSIPFANQNFEQANLETITNEILRKVSIKELAYDH